MEAEFEAMEEEYETSRFGCNSLYKTDQEEYVICGVDEDDTTGRRLEADQVQAWVVM
jgi:hypothetical protein